MRVLIVFLLVVSYSCAIAQQVDTVQTRIGLMLGFNHFPGFYVPWETHYINEVPYGYNIGFFKEGKRRFNFRAGVNTNIYRRKSSVRVMEYYLGLESGVEFCLLARKRNWILNFGVMAYKGWAWSYHYNSPTSSVRYLIDEWEVGPDLLLGYKMNQRWVATFESSVAIGGAVYKRNGTQYGSKFPALNWWKFLGFGIRYYLR
jgi:hypothetical protein